MKGRPKKVAKDKAKSEAQAKEDIFVKIEKADQKLLRLEKDKQEKLEAIPEPNDNASMMKMKRQKKFIWIILIMMTKLKK